MNQGHGNKMHVRKIMLYIEYYYSYIKYKTLIVSLPFQPICISIKIRVTMTGDNICLSIGNVHDYVIIIILIYSHNIASFVHDCRPILVQGHRMCIIGKCFIFVDTERVTERIKPHLVNTMKCYTAIPRKI